ncbi:transposase family protein [Photorhabdus khanii NC19]|uniref:Transposase family protein n=1 Tax=Photorhabdus khanii NC19 TaxID=1004151 RepID=W3V3T1_9GAMM|nr:transposase family protein [Photorhabdus khanii NC19]
MAVYRCRWQVELLFRELKSHTHWTSFATGQKAIAEGLIWASLLALIVRRSLARRFLPSVSFLKAAKNVDVGLLPILGTIIHHAWSEIEHPLDWALKYLAKNALKLPQGKSNKNNGLEGIFERLNT